MPTYEKCDKTVRVLADAIIEKHESHHPLRNAGVKIDLVFALSDKDEETGAPLNHAILKNGIKALGLTKGIGLKDRVLGRGDAEILIDGDWWQTASAEQQEALLDHELHHIIVKTDKHGNVQRDDINRTLVGMRKHDIEVGWFTVIAERNGKHSQEQIQAWKIMDKAGQWLWPDLCPPSGAKFKALGTGAKATSVNV